MADSVTINSIDQTQIANGYVNVSCTVSVSSTSYPQVFTVNATDPVSVASSVQQQAEAYRQQVLTTVDIVSNPTVLADLVNEVIDL
jgi:hypothetical protein